MYVQLDRSWYPKLRQFCNATGLTAYFFYVRYTAGPADLEINSSFNFTFIHSLFLETCHLEVHTYFYSFQRETKPPQRSVCRRLCSGSFKKHQRADLLWWARPRVFKETRFRSSTFKMSITLLTDGKCTISHPALLDHTLMTTWSYTSSHCVKNLPQLILTWNAGNSCISQQLLIQLSWNENWFSRVMNCMDTNNKQQVQDATSYFKKKKKYFGVEVN